MKAQAHFSDIREVIIHQLSEAKIDVLVAVAWLTDRTLFDSLVTCQRRGVSVSLAVLDDHINRESSIAWESLTAIGGRLCWIPEGTTRAGSLHHKFCLIDNDTVINGSFNWTYRASSADENIIIIQGDTDFAKQFQRAFMHLLDKHGHDAEPIVIDRANLLSRLTVISKLLELEDYEELPAQINKLDHAKSSVEIADPIAIQKHQDLLTSILADQLLLKTSANKPNIKFNNET
jgi:phosphatidylserine/phosphatidylglycerophosphate/cardiolipin synthase-like enzyme